MTYSNPQLVKLPLLFLVSTMVGTPLKVAAEAESVGTEQARLVTNTGSSSASSVRPVLPLTPLEKLRASALLLLLLLGLPLLLPGVVGLTSKSLQIM